MDTRNGIRERRQERIRRIMESNAAQAQAGRHSVEPQLLEPQTKRLQAQPILPQPAQADSRVENMQEHSVHPVRLREEDPERLWKANPNPWQTAGWNIAPLPSKDIRASKAGGPPPDPSETGGRFIVRGLFIQSVIAAALFVIVYLMFQTQMPAAKKGQEAVTAALTENMDFNASASLYKKWFAGAPSFIPFFGSKDEESRLAEGAVEMPIVSPLPNGAVVRSFAETLSGVEIAGKPEQSVLAAETGRVILVSNNGDTEGATVMVQHAGGRVTVYGRLGSVIVSANDWVEAGKTLGKLSETKAEDGSQSLLFFAVKEQGRYVNPADVVPID
ncbi:M23 family metallopeptidase [Paenibacillus sacheonensis]|uniref:Peptidoglycan DD-metalloendopeptidase family protein n=1 Tax=Paenibacillus sacheonensis TaxID=742054 RepID=A0A7X5BWT8_9BACL|nr:M23 family metallopeptidase [Paenibacillus sacheonensis]MBM7563771.1 stage IV sporulation protein FA [Paenibacillus sacheonensis]NBC67877.1 peptidoglycan DD-metalloendopeptidase family protein [Paenibacillus sacheonensis]